MNNFFNQGNITSDVSSASLNHDNGTSSIKEKLARINLALDELHQKTLVNQDKNQKYEELERENEVLKAKNTELKEMLAKLDEEVSEIIAKVEKMALNVQD